jgi:SAM-dependent methyltransferase
MLDQLRQIVANRAGRIDLTPLARRFGKTADLQTPMQAFDIAQELSRLALPHLPEGGGSTAEQGADALVRFIAGMPEDLAASIRGVPAFVPVAARAWLEPQMDAFVALSCTVQDIWAHLAGPEAEDDGAIAQALVWHSPHRVLDFGCGAGHFAHLLCAAGASVDGIEPDPVKRAFFQFRARHFALERSMRLGQHGAVYDTVLALNVLDHMEDPTPALELFARTLAPGGLLCTVAAFPNDGWHQSDEPVVQRCAARILREYCHSEYPGTLPAWTDCWVKRPDSASEEPPADGLPQLHPATVVHPQADGSCVLHANRFYSRQVALDEDTVQVCRALDGTKTISALALRHEVDEDDLRGLCEALDLAGQLIWRPSIGVNHGAVPAKKPRTLEAATPLTQEHTS